MDIQNQKQMVEYRVVEGDGTKLPAGTGLMLDWREGRLYDKQGNQVAKWEARDDERNAALADYASHLALYSGAFALSKTDKERAAAMAMRGESILLGEDDDVLMDDEGDEESFLMDIGPADVHIPSAMANFASGYKNEPPIADLVCPVILANKQVDDYWQFAKEDAFQRVAPVAGATTSGVPEIAPRVANAQYSAKQRALGAYVSTELEANADAPLKLLLAATRRVTNALTLEREIRVQALLRTSGNWAGALVSNLGAGFQWNGGQSADPVKDLHARIEASWGDPTGIIMSKRLWHAFTRNPVVRGYYAYKSNVNAVPSPKDIQAILELPPIYVSSMKYINSANALDYVWGNDCVLIRQPEEMPPTSQEDVATAYTFRWNVQNPRDGVAKGGFIVRQFYNQHRGPMGGLQVIVVHFDAEQMTSQWVGGLIQNAYQ